MNYRYTAVTTLTLLFVGIAVSCDSPTENNNIPTVIEWSDTNSVVCYGTDFTYGTGADSDSTYPAFLQDRLQIEVVNFGTPGALTEYGVTHMDSVLTFNPVLVLLEFGATEYFLEYEPAEVRSDLRSVIDFFQVHGVHVALLSFAHPDMSSLYPNDPSYQDDIALGIRYSEMYGDIASQYPIPFINYMFKDVWGDPVLMADSIHPNGKGYQQVEYNITEVLFDIFRENGMLK